jgi:hypothetical protein
MPLRIFEERADRDGHIPLADLKGAAAAMKYLRDPDFNRAVKEIIQECTVKVDPAKVEC